MCSQTFYRGNVVITISKGRAGPSYSAAICDDFSRATPKSALATLAHFNMSISGKICLSCQHRPRSWVAQRRTFWRRSRQEATTRSSSTRQNLCVTDHLIPQRSHFEYCLTGNGLTKISDWGKRNCRNIPGSPMKNLRLAKQCLNKFY